VRVLYTDYEYLLAYTCSEYSGEKCMPGSDKVVVFSRSPATAYHKLEYIMQGINTVCFDINDFEWTSRQGKFYFE